MEYITKKDVDAALTELVTELINDSGKILYKVLHSKLIKKMKESNTFRQYVDVEKIVLSRIDASKSEWLDSYIKNRIKGSK